MGLTWIMLPQLRFSAVEVSAPWISRQLFKLAQRSSSIMGDGDSSCAMKGIEEIC